ncbi:SPFH domain-containing protein [Poseidonocella sedimentorum]|uniref:Membrane protease subunit, stomatin/prohibitin family, contains C-terminal Zn-ribbon domain n=1 Tax=Poseidonocella sedimentorum TaxID=871652 RepID=A0A1I6E6E7_9RHOB|nr:SPFH domain-containing protein [Poseidonocella sedimentorum]SFR13068.1 Membrane protease subunit, stomatin/prohibitin family, contains C-terminal Zn-ribbon domain [Poseidonocella sedimentorum]
MGILDFLTGEFIDVIHWVNDSRDTMVWRFEREGHAIKYGAKLTVREGQAAVFVHEGQLADVFTPGLYMLETNNMPVLTTLQHWDHGFRSPFKSEIYYVNTTRFTDLKWGTKNPIMCRDPEFGPVRLRAFGTYAIRVVDPARFLLEIVGTDGEFTADEISFQIRNVIVAKAAAALASSGIPVLDMAANTPDLGKLIAAQVSPQLAEYGLEMPEFYVENISLPKAVEEAMDRRTSMGIVGDLGKYTQFSAAEAMAGSGGSGEAGAGIGAGLGMGVGMAMGNQMARQGPWGASPAQASPVPAAPQPVEHVWHLARDGQTFGPYSKADLGQMAVKGELTRSTHVWTPGQDGWKHAEEVTELAQLFTILPPPPPPAG